jgi:hypothetical protein
MSTGRQPFSVSKSEENKADIIADIHKKYFEF